MIRALRARHRRYGEARGWQKRKQQSCVLWEEEGRRFGGGRTGGHERPTGWWDARHGIIGQLVRIFGHLLPAFGVVAFSPLARSRLPCMHEHVPPQPALRPPLPPSPRCALLHARAAACHGVAMWVAAAASAGACMQLLHACLQIAAPSHPPPHALTPHTCTHARSAYHTYAQPTTRTRTHTKPTHAPTPTEPSKPQMCSGPYMLNNARGLPGYATHHACLLACAGDRCLTWQRRHEQHRPWPSRGTATSSPPPFPRLRAAPSACGPGQCPTWGP